MVLPEPYIKEGLCQWKLTVLIPSRTEKLVTKMSSMRVTVSITKVSSVYSGIFALHFFLPTCLYLHWVVHLQLVCIYQLVCTNLFLPTCLYLPTCFYQLVCIYQLVCTNLFLPTCLYLHWVVHLHQTQDNFSTRAKMAWIQVSFS